MGMELENIGSLAWAERRQHEAVLEVKDGRVGERGVHVPEKGLSSRNLKK